MVGNMYISYTITWIDDNNNLQHRSNLCEREASKEWEMLIKTNPIKAELLEVQHIHKIIKTHVDNIKTDNNKRMLEKMQRNNKTVKQLCLLLGV